MRVEVCDACSKVFFKGSFVSVSIHSFIVKIQKRVGGT